MSYPGHPDQWFGGSSYSQHGEDIAILNFFTLLGIPRPSYLDIGANHPVNISNTVLFWLKGSNGVNVDANPNVIELFNKQRPNDVNLNVGISVTPGTMPFYMIDELSGRNTFDLKEIEKFVSEYPTFKITKTIDVPTIPINELVKSHCPDGVFPDFLNMDIEGMDYSVLKSCDFSKSSPKIICVEAREENSSDFSELLKSTHECLCRFGANLLFVRNDLIEKLKK